MTTSQPRRPRPYSGIVSYYERCLDDYGDSYRGVGWTKSEANAETRQRVMLDVIRDIRERPVTLLDLGCGTHIVRRALAERIDYSGLDVSAKFLKLARSKFPHVTFYEIDLLDDAALLPTFDYVVMNGVFTFKDGLSQEEMIEYWRSLVSRAFEHAAIGIAFNVMSKQVEWERDDLFHLPFDELAGFLAAQVTPAFTIRHDYGLYEYTTYVYR